MGLRYRPLPADAVTNLHIFATPSVAHFPSVQKQLRRDNWSLAFTFAQIFVLVQLGMNWDAYRINAEYFWQNQVAPLLREPVLPPKPAKLPELGLVSSTAENIDENLHTTIVPLDTRLIIPKLKQNVPIIHASDENLIAQDWDKLEKQIQQELQRGVVHYPATANAGENGNMVISGHSSYYPWDPGRYKTVFALLEKMEVGDEFTIFQNQQEYKYRVTQREIIKATQVDVLDQNVGERVTLITCWPTGTNHKRLIVVGERI